MPRPILFDEREPGTGRVRREAAKSLARSMDEEEGNPNMRIPVEEGAREGEFTVSLQDLPALEKVKVGDPVTIRGSIASVRGNLITIRYDQTLVGEEEMAAAEPASTRVDILAGQVPPIETVGEQPVIGG